MVRPSRKDQDETVGAHEVNLASVLAAMGQVTLISASILPLSSDVIHRTVFIFLWGGGVTKAHSWDICNLGMFI